MVWATMGGIRRAQGMAQRRAKPLLREDLFVVLGAMGDRHKNLRDRALTKVISNGRYVTFPMAQVTIPRSQRASARRRWRRRCFGSESRRFSMAAPGILEALSEDEGYHVGPNQTRDPEPQKGLAPRLAQLHGLRRRVHGCS